MNILQIGEPETEETVIDIINAIVFKKKLFVQKCLHHTAHGAGRTKLVLSQKTAVHHLLHTVFSGNRSHNSLLPFGNQLTISLIHRLILFHNGKQCSFNNFRSNDRFTFLIQSVQ